MIPDPNIDIEDANENPDEVADDGLGSPEPPEVVTDADVDEDEPPTAQALAAMTDDEFAGFVRESGIGTVTSRIPADAWPSPGYIDTGPTEGGVGSE